MAAALRATTQQRAAEAERVRALRDQLAEGIAASAPGAFFNGDSLRKIAGNCHVGFPGVEAEALLLLLDQQDVCAAAGSACTSGSMDPSHVLLAMGLGRERALVSIRLSLGWTSTAADIDEALDVIPAAVERLRPARRR